ncbi:MAG: transketolase [Pseudomonadota bacterium]
MAAAISVLSMDAVEKAKSGHPGMPMGMADVATVLFTRHLKFDANAPDWADRDRFVLSAGHGSMLIYSLLHLLGYEGATMEELKRFRQLGSKTAGHPEYDHLPGIETTTGPLGQGIGNAVGMAIAEAHLRARYGEDLVDHYTYALAGDGCLMEGISQEAIALAGHLKLGKLIVLWDDNGITIDGKVSLSDSTDQRARFEASGWKTLACDGHDPEDIDRALEEAKGSDRPVMIACKTVIGKFAPTKAGTAGAHGAPLGADEIAAVREALGWDLPPFELPEDVVSAWRAAGERGADDHRAWKARHGSDAKSAEFDAALAADPAPAIRSLATHAAQLAEEGKPVATRKASQAALEHINAALPMTIGGSADLTGSNNTKTGDLGILDAENYAGRYIHYGIREHGMGAAMNGIALHGGITVYSGGFLVFADYMRPSMRLAALMEQQVIYVMTHDSIGLGEDGPTHQPVEHLASLRAIPNMAVFRPADAVETAEAWAAALARKNGPSVLALTRQNIGPVRTSAAENMSAKGGYILKNVSGAKATILATGSEVDIALAAQGVLQDEGIPVRVASIPCMELFVTQNIQYIAEVLGDVPRLGIEAGIQQGWDRTLGAFGQPYDFLGMTGFGASAPYQDLYEHFGLTAQAAAERVRALIERN